MLKCQGICRCGGMVDTADLKSAGGNSVPVRVRSAAPEKGYPVKGIPFLHSGQNLKNRIRGIDLGSKFLMHINISRGGNRTVSQPGLNIFQADTVGKKQTGTAMPEIVKPNATHIMFFQELRELGTEIVRPHQFSEFIVISESLRIKWRIS